MESLTQQDFQGILNFVQKLYSVDYLQNLPAYIATTVTHLVQADFASYSGTDFINRQLLGGVIFPVFPVNVECMEQYFNEHPLQADYLKTQNWRAQTLSDFLSEKQLHQTEGVYQGFLRSMAMEEQMVLILPHQNPMVVDAISLFRSQRNFTERDRLILNLLQPHLLQARQTGQVFAQIQQENKQLRDSLTATGSIIITEAGHVQFMTAKAENWIQQYFPCSHLEHTTLPDHLHQWVIYQQSLHQTNGSVPKPHFPLKIEQDGKQLVIRFVADPMNSQSILVLEEHQSPSLSIESLEYLGLSKREAEVLFWVAKGKENPEIAKILCVSTVTIRKHLEHVYQKLQVKTRAAAIVTALQKLGVLSCE